MWRAAPSWAEVLLVGACVTTAALVLFSAACAQPTGPAHLSVTKTEKPRVVTGENQIFTIRVTNQIGDTARDMVMRNPLPDEVRRIPAGPVAELASVERSAPSRLFSLEQRRSSRLVKFTDSALHEIAKDIAHRSYSFSDAEGSFWIT